MPIFEAYLHAELERWKTEEKLAEYMQGKEKRSNDAELQVEKNF